MPQLLLPDNIPVLSRDSDSLISLPATYLNQPARITIGGQQYKLSSGLTLNTGVSGLGGVDTGTVAANTLYYVYVVRNTGGAVGLTMSVAAPSSGPTGFTAWKEIGRFRTRSSGTQIAPIVVNRIVGANTPQNAVGDWQTLAFTLANLGSKGITTHISKARYSNTSLEVEMRIQLNAVASGVGANNFNVVFPAGWTIDTTKVAETGGRVGAFTSYGLVAADQYDEEAAMYFESTTALRFVKPGTGIYLITTDLNVARIVAFNLYFTVPIVELAGLFT